MSDSIIRVAIVGTGIMAKTHARILAQEHRALLVAWVSRTQTEPLPEFPDVPVFDDVHVMAATVHPAMVIVATPDFAHVDAAISAAQEGCHVLVEKPLATSGADAERISAAVSDAGVQCMTLFNQRWAPPSWEAKRALAGEEAGRPVMAYARKNDTIFVPTEMIGWAAKSSPSWFLSSHDIDLVTWLIGQTPTSVYASASAGILSARGINTVDAVHAQVRFAGGAIATFESCWVVPNGYPAVVESFVEVVSEHRIVHLDRKIEQLEIADDERMHYPRTAGATVGDRIVGPVVSAISHFLDVVEGVAQPLIPVEHSVGVTWLLEAIERSYTTGRPVTLSDGRL